MLVSSRKCHRHFQYDIRSNGLLECNVVMSKPLSLNCCLNKDNVNKHEAYHLCAKTSYFRRNNKKGDKSSMKI